ncbi:MAG: sulfate ABC transporter ATP-binding protein [Firmicutes bacterium]|nr:sulfate ABC transporter ATP-binding protein [Bacillota bacterium]
MSQSNRVTLPDDGAYVEMRHIYKNFGGFCASDDVSFSVGRGSLTALLGPSGSGKTTILRMLAGLDHPDSGEIYIGGRLVNQVEASKRGVGFVFQNYALFRYMTVFENIAFGLQVQHRPKAEIKARVEELLELIGLSGLGSRFPNQLSGGQRQRVAFARALAPDPQLLLLDEPFAAIDAKLRLELRSWLRQMIHQVGVTSIFVTHDQEEALDVADSIVVTNRGRVEQSGSPQEIYGDPRTAFVARFLGQSLEVADARALAGFGGADGLPALVRPENVALWTEEETPQLVPFDSATVGQVSFHGGYTQLELTLDNGLALRAQRAGHLPSLSPGQRVGAAVRELFLLDGDQARRLRHQALAAE